MSKSNRHKLMQLKKEYLDGSPLSLTKLAEKYGVPRSVVYQAKKRERWELENAEETETDFETAATLLQREIDYAEPSSERLTRCAKLALMYIENGFDALEIPIEQERVRTYKTASDGSTVETTHTRTVRSSKPAPRIDYTELEKLTRCLKNVREAIEKSGGDNKNVDNCILIMPEIKGSADSGQD